MATVKIVLGSQTFECEVVTRDHERTYRGKLPGAIDDKEALRFWAEYEEVVTGCMFRHVDSLEREMKSHPFRVLFGKNEYLGADVDLQIYPSTLAVSFTIP